VRVALNAFPKGAAFAVRFVNRAQFRRHWITALGPAAETSILS
jgi:hypothetical protein